jgi:hypothetical protein
MACRWWVFAQPYHLGVEPINSTGATPNAATAQPDQ